MTVLQELQVAIDREPGFSLALTRGEKDLSYSVEYDHPQVGKLMADVSFKGNGSTTIDLCKVGVVVSWEMQWRRGSSSSKASCVRHLCETMREPSGLLAVRHGEAMKEQIAAREMLVRWQTQLQNLTIALEQLR